MSMIERETIDLEQGWELIQKGIKKMKNILEGLTEDRFSSEECEMLNKTLYKMCIHDPLHNHSRQLHNKFREFLEEDILSTVLPALREKHDEVMFRELVRRWANYKIMVMWLSHLSRYFIARKSLQPLIEVGLTRFRELVYKGINVKVRDAVISLINQERDGNQIDRALLKNVLCVFLEMGMGQMDCYENDFEAAMLKDTASYYSRKASNWILEYSFPDYILKAEECLKREKERVAHYLHSSSEPKLLEVCSRCLISYKGCYNREDGIFLVLSMLMVFSMWMTL